MSKFDSTPNICRDFVITLEGRQRADTVGILTPPLWRRVASVLAGCAALLVVALPVHAAENNIGVTTGVDANVATESRTWNSTTGNIEAVTTWPSNVSTMATAQPVIAVTNTAVAIFGGAATKCRGAIVKAKCTNSANAFVVGISTVTTSTGFILDPCDSVFLEPPDGDDCNKIFINGTAGDGASVIRK